MIAGAAGICAVSAGFVLLTGVAQGSPHRSTPEFVTPRCKTAPYARACAVALRYLAALDLDRAAEACGLLDRSTLEAAGGMAACKKMLLQVRGIRLRYRLRGVARSPLGTTIRFSTRATGRLPVRQQMLISPAGRILAVIPEPQ